MLLGGRELPPYDHDEDPWKSLPDEVEKQLDYDGLKALWAKAGITSCEWCDMLETLTQEEIYEAFKWQAQELSAENRPPETQTATSA
jgi:hypothetical protein